MALNKREKTIAAILGATLVGYVIYFYGIDQYNTEVVRVEKAQQKATADLVLGNHLIENRKSVNQDWQTFLNNGLKSNPSDAESVTLHALADWAQAHNVHIDSHKTDAPYQSGDFQEMRLTITGSGNLASIWRFIADIETSKYPLQIRDLHLASKKADGSDDLSVQLTVNTLIFSPPETTTKPSRKPAQTGGDAI